MKTTHTPGPWRIAPHNETEIQGKDGGLWVLRATAWGGTPEEIYANANLVASAPDLLSACKAAQEWIDDACNDDSDTQHEQDIQRGG